MSIEVPELDEAEYEALLEQAKTVIASRSDTWTDFNPHDPGVTILELLAWLTETHSYEFDRITDAHREKYLRLLGASPHPPRPASVRLDLSSSGSTGRLPAGTRLSATDGDRTLQFTTDHATTITDASIAAVVTDAGEPTPRTTANDTAGMSFRAFGDEPTAGDAMALGFDGDPFSSGDLTLFVDFYDDDLPDPAGLDADSLAFDPPTFEPSVDLCWEFCRPKPAGDGVAWEPLAVVDDTTTRFYETGFVTLERPEPWRPAAWDAADADLFDSDSGLVWLRCRLRRGGYEIPPQFDSVETNVVTASHRRRHEAALEPVGDGPAPRTYRFDHAPVLSATVSIDGEPWTEVADFDASGPNDRHYVLDRAAGELTVGDAERGVRPAPDASVTASYVAGGGPAGNVPATAVWTVDDPDRPLGDGTLAGVDISPRGPATGGRAAESVADAADRVRRERRTPHRAVIEDDYAAIAERTPGLRIARTAVRLPESTDTPAVTVVVVPYAPPEVDRPSPSEGFRAAVHQQLDRRRLLTDRIEVVGPTYVGLAVSVSVTPAEPVDGGVRTAVERRLRSYLDPIRGFEGDGWPFGRSVSTADIEAQLRAAPAVGGVESVSVRAIGDAAVDADGTVRVDDRSLFALDTLDVEIAGPTDGGERP
ncbi:putative baseplate assembly protein [Halohasta salina]|uniref:putative baseplate assembly protein n=1 Tax=Halohasta salina TaxID=2961621 RepID=UPI0020A41D30|nr:putative baseplate assembly protein [Halohasta salina]